MTITPKMFDALQRAHQQPLRRIFDDREGQPPWPAAPATLHALERHGLVVVSERRSRQGYRIIEWSATEAALPVLYPPPVLMVDRPRFLQRFVSHGGDYTTVRARAIDPLQAVDAPESIVQAGRVRHRESLSAGVRANNIRRAA